MSKPLGIDHMMRVTTPNIVEDRVWDAVKEAIDAGWDAKRFRREAARAWEEESNKRTKYAVEDLLRS